MDPRTSLREVARSLKIDELTVRNRLRRLELGGFLKGWRLFVNPALLHANLTQILFDLRDSTEDLSGKLKGLPGVGAIVEHIGKSMWVVVYHNDEKSLNERERMIERTAKAKAVAIAKIRAPKCDVSLYPTDVEIIAALSKNPRKPYSMVAKELGLSTRTVRRRLQRMVDGRAVFVLPSMDPGSLEGALLVDLLVEYSDGERSATTFERLLPAMDDFLIRAQPGDPRYGFFNLFVTKLSVVSKILKEVQSIPGVKSARADLVQSRWEMYDAFLGDSIRLMRIAT